MASKIPEKILVKSFLDKMDKSANKWSTKKTEDGQIVLDVTTHNTALVINALRESAREAGYMSLMFALMTCKIDNVE